MLAAQRSRTCFWTLAAALAAISCDVAVPESAPRGRLDFALFRTQVYPVLLRDCGFAACHGAPDRFFRVWGPGRTRLPGAGGVTLEPFGLPTIDEWSASHTAALAFIEEAAPATSDLLRKPLAVAAGGADHGGIDAYGRNVYRTTDDEGFQILQRWVHSQPPEPPAGGN